MTMTAIGAGVVLALLGLSLPALLVYVLRAAEREDRSAEEEVARALARVTQTVAGSSAPRPTGHPPSARQLTVPARTSRPSRPVASAKPPHGA